MDYIFVAGSMALAVVNLTQLAMRTDVLCGGYKAVQGHSRSPTNKKPVCNLLLVIDTNLCSISHRFQVIAAYIITFNR